MAVVGFCTICRITDVETVLGKTTSRLATATAQLGSAHHHGWSGHPCRSPGRLPGSTLPPAEPGFFAAARSTNCITERGRGALLHLGSAYGNISIIIIISGIVGRYYHHPCCYWYCCCGRIAVYDACQQRRPLSSDYIQTRREPLVIKIEQQKSCRIFVDHRGSNSNPHENALMSATRIFRYYVPYPRRGH